MILCRMTYTEVDGGNDDDDDSDDDIQDIHVSAVCYSQTCPLDSAFVF